MNQEPFFLQLREKTMRHAVAVKLVMILEGRIVTGLPTGNEGFVDRTNAVIDNLAAQLPDTDPLRANVAGLRFDPPSEEDLLSGFISLREATVRDGLAEFELGLVRIDLSKVTAWGVLPPAAEGDAAPAAS